MTLNNVRMYKNGDKIESRRFLNFHNAYENYKSVSQSGKKNEYNIDLAQDEYKTKDFTNPVDMLWVTFKC